MPVTFSDHSGPPYGRRRIHLRYLSGSWPAPLLAFTDAARSYSGGSRQASRLKAGSPGPFSGKSYYLK